MILNKLKLHNFRNFPSLDLGFSSNINIITGSNGAGKTSILEAVYLLATGRSFRAANLSKLISFNEDQLGVYSEFYTKIGSSHQSVKTIGYLKSKNTGRQLKVDDKNVSSISEVAHLLPVSCLEGGFFRALINEPLFRRKMLDWGVFHVKHSFFSTWKKYQEILQQRNQLLKNRAAINSISTWNRLFADSAMNLLNLREEYIQEVAPIFIEYLKSFETLNNSVSVRVSHGVGCESADEIIIKLQDSLEKDLERGFTSFGPHRADLVFKCKQGNAKDILSRGQQKIVLISFFLAQLQLLKDKNNKNSLILIDDLASELDDEVLNILYKHLSELEHQIVITAINQESFPCFIKPSNIIQL